MLRGHSAPHSRDLSPSTKEEFLGAWVAGSHCAGGGSDSCPRRVPDRGSVTNGGGMRWLIRRLGRQTGVMSAATERPLQPALSWGPFCFRYTCAQRRKRRPFTSVAQLELQMAQEAAVAGNIWLSGVAPGFGFLFGRNRCDRPFIGRYWSRFQSRQRFRVVWKRCDRRFTGLRAGLDLLTGRGGGCGGGGQLGQFHHCG